MKILVVAAMPNELKAIKEWIKSANLKVNLNIDYLCCGVWNYETISSLEHYLTEKLEPTFIWNVWVCGYWNQNNEKKSKPIQIASVINIHNGKEIIIPPFLKLEQFKTCFSSENVVFKKPIFQKEFLNENDEMYFDMESRWIEFVASKYKYPRLILKVPFDFIGNDENISVENYRDLSAKISNILKNLPYQNYLEDILKWMKNNE